MVILRAELRGLRQPWCGSHLLQVRIDLTLEALLLLLGGLGLRYALILETTPLVLLQGATLLLHPALDQSLSGSICPQYPSYLAVNTPFRLFTDH